MAARGSTVMQFVPSEVYQSATPPESPAVGQLWRNTGVTPNELLAWTGKGPSNARSYAGTRSGESVSFDELSDDRKLHVSTVTVAKQASGTPTLTGPIPIEGRDSVTVKTCVQNPGDNLLPLSNVGVTGGAVGDWSAGGAHYAKSPVSADITGYASQYSWGELTFGGLTLVPGQVYVLSFWAWWHKEGGPAVAGGDGGYLRWNFLHVSPYHDFYPDSFGFTDADFSSDIPFGGPKLYRFPFTLPASVTSAYSDWILRFLLFNSNDPNKHFFVSDVRIKLAPDASDWSAAPQHAIGVAHVLNPITTLWGIPAMADSISSNGQVVHNTGGASFDGSESGWHEYSDQASINTRLYVIPVFADGATDRVTLFPGLRCNRATDAGEAIWFGGASADVGSVCALHSPYGQTSFHFCIRVLRSLCPDLAAFKAWLGSNPLQVVFRREVPVVETCPPVAINGGSNLNIVSSDATAMTVEYTGSGWAALGAVQRMTIESVSISPEEGLRVDTVLSSADGAHHVPTFFNARGARYGLFRSSDGMMILGGMVLPNGQPAGVAGALVSPGTAGDTRIGIETASEGSGQARVDTAALHLVQPSFAGATGPNPAPTGEKAPVRIEAVRSTLLNAQSEYVDNYSVSLKALNAMRLVALNESGGELAWLTVQRASEGSTIYTDGAYSASDRARTLSNFAPMIHMSMPAGESIVYNATARRYMLDWKTIEDDYGRYGTFKGGNQSLWDVGIVIQMSGYYRFVLHADLEQGSSSSGAVLHINRMPVDWMPPTACDYVTDADLAPQRIAYRRAASAPLNASVTTCDLVADMWCFSGEKILPVVSTAAASKTLVSAGTFFTAQKIG